MPKTYFMGPENTGVANSLMNLLVELDDTATALEVPIRYKDSPLTASDLTLNPMLLTRAVRDFTNNRYLGILYANLVPDIESALRKDYDDGKRDFKRIVETAREEIELGNIKPHKGLIPQNRPEILLIEAPDHSKDLHILVATKEGKYIDDGFLFAKEQLESLGYDLMPVGVLQVKRRL